MNVRHAIIRAAVLSALAFSACTEHTSGTCETDSECPAGQRCKLDWPDKYRCVNRDVPLVPDGGAVNVAADGSQPQPNDGGADTAPSPSTRDSSTPDNPSPDTRPPDAGGSCSTSTNCTSAAFPVCDTDTNRCVACLDNTQCAGATAFCVNKRCVACTEDSHCTVAEKPVCDKVANTCGACTTDAQCKAKSPAAPVCAPGGRCAQCKASADCSGPTPACSQTTNTCVACVDDTQCTTTAKPICDKTKNQCTGCGSDGQCKAKNAAAPACLMDGSCAQCKASTDCSGATPVCNVTVNKCVVCTDDTNCGTADKPICDKAANVCVPCMADAQCEAKNTATKGCAAGRCVPCTKSDHCSGVTAPICGTNNTCGPCTADAQCAMKGNLGPNPGVCMAHVDGHCATDTETVYVESKVGCASTAGAGGTASAPYCLAQLGVDAARSAAKPLVVMRGSLSPGFEAAPNVGIRLSVIGQSNAQVVASSSGSGTAVRLSSGDVYLRSLVIMGATGTGTGVSASPGSTLRLESVKIDSNPKGGILIDGAFYDLKNVLVIRNGVGIYGTNTTWSGILINDPPAGSPARLERVSIVQNSSPGLNCTQTVQSTSLLATGNGGLDIIPACGLLSCGAAALTCGSDLPP